MAKDDAKEPEKRNAPDEVSKDEEEVTRYRYTSTNWRVSLTDKNLEKYAALGATEKYEFLARKMRLLPGTIPARESIGTSFVKELRAIQRTIDGGGAEGSRGVTLERSSGLPD